MPVDRRTRDTKFFSDLSDGVSAFPIITGLVVHSLSKDDLTGAKLGLLATGTTPRTRSSQPVAGAFGHQRVLELRDRPDDRKEQSTNGSRGVDSLIKDHQVDLVVLQLA